MTGSVSYVTPTLDPAPLSRYAMSATSAATKAAVRSVVGQEYQMLITARNVLRWRRIGMDVLKLSTWALQRRIYFMNGKNTDLKSGE